MDLWEEVYPGGPLLALIGTFLTAAFFEASDSPVGGSLES
jgi:hypothetical protein